MKNKLGYLVRVISEYSVYYNKIGIVTIVSGKALGVIFSKKQSDWINQYEVEYLYDEPQFNVDIRSYPYLCFWCGTKLKRHYVKEKFFCYCPKCLR